ncbi:MAG: 2OG-Fe(II) oxygenase [Proteobacteria bacterium]|nr:2OG-Fe(II) oxygenase [Pseudomonadota bacterium]
MFDKLVHIFEGEDRLSAAHCDQVIELGKKYPAKDAQVGYGDKHMERKGLRRSELRWISPQEAMVTNLLWYYANIANRNSFGVDAFWLYDIQLTAYHGEDQGYYNWHQDCFFEQATPYQRKLSLIVQLSSPDEYEGGELMFTTQYVTGWNEQKAQKIKEKGTVIVFPSFYTHKVNPVTKGTRRSLVAWIEGPSWK